MARANSGALEFWRRVAASVSQEVQELDLANEHWNGPILRFVAP